jgi:hypothetical protein
VEVSSYQSFSHISILTLLLYTSILKLYLCINPSEWEDYHYGGRLLSEPVDHVCLPGKF